MNRTAPSPRSTQIHQGWLKKKGKRRWFILQGYSLYWFAKEQRAVTFQHKDVKGCLELKGYAVSVNREKTHTFIVSNLHEMNYYELTAATEASMNEWVECIRGCIQKVADAEGTPQEQQLEGKRGVLTKKGQERLFVLKDDSLMWFLSKTGAEKKAKGSLPLKDVTLKRGPKGYSFVLQPKVGKAYILFAASQSECDEWMAAVSKVIDILNNTQTAVKSGWLEKKGQKRYFVIKNGKLLWFKKVQKDDDVEANGYLLLESCTVTVLPPANGKYSLHIVSAQNDKERTKREYTLTATSEAECTDWVTALSSASTGETPPTPHWRLSMRAKPGSDPAVVSAGVGAGVGAPLDSPVSRGAPLPAASAAFSENFLSADKSGWLEKKGKRRWFVVTNGEFAWYDQPRQHERGEKPNGSIVAKEASVASIGEIGNGYFAFAVYSATGKDTEYLLQASSLNEMEDWVVALVLAGASPEKEKDRASTVVEEVMTRPDGLPENDKNGWMEKKGRKRWFVLRNSHLYWYKAVQENETGLKQEAAGSLDLRECTVKKLDEKIKGKPALLLSSTSKGEYLLLHQNQEEIDSWVKLIIEKGGASKYRPAAVMGKYGEESGTKNYFGLSLQQLLEKEGPAHSGIPILVLKCIDHIRQHGMEAEGIFRVSGEQIDIVGLKQEFESTTDTSSITFPTNIDVHSVSGLLKMFFRELNPPLMTFELYSDFMAAAGCVMSEIKGLIAQLPAENKTLLRYLMWFLYDVAQLGDLNKMRPMNLAIVFSPNLFRSDKSAFEVLANSSNAATVTQFIISNAHELFPEDAPASTDTTTAPTFGAADVVMPPLPVFPVLPPMPSGVALPPIPGGVGLPLPPVPGGVGLPPLPTRPQLPPYHHHQQQQQRASAMLQYAPPQLQVPGKIAAELAQRQFAQKGAAGGPAQ